MNLELTLPIFHVSLGLVLITAAAFAFLSERKSITNQLIAILLILLGLTSIGIGLELNALTPSQALPWVALEVFSVYALSTATFVIALILLLPEIGNRPIVRLVGVGLIVIPLILLIVDLLNQSIPLFGYHFLIDIDKFTNNFTPGYQDISEAADGPVQLVLFWLRNLSYGILIFFPLLYVYWRDRNTNSFNSTNALILLITTVITAVINIAFIDALPITVSSLLSTLFFGVAFTIISVRTSESVSSTGRSFDFFQNIPMFNKLLLLVIGIILPSLVFLGFSIYSYLQTTLIQNSNNYLQNFANSEAETTANELNNLLHHLEGATHDNEIRNLITEANQVDGSLPYGEIADVPQFSISDYVSIEELIGDHGEINSITLINTNGASVTSYGEIRIADYHDLPWWDEVSEQIITSVGIPTWEEELNRYVLQVRIPILGNTGQFIGASEISYTLNTLLSAFEQSAGSDVGIGINIADETLIFSRIGEISSSNLPQTIGLQQTGMRSWNVINLENQFVFVASQPVILDSATNQLEWEITTYQSLNSALETLYTSRTGLLIITSIIITISVVAVLFLARGISDPLQQLTAAAESLLVGNLDVEIPLSGEDEIGILAETLTTMSAELNRVVNNLEATVDSRTKDLQKRTLQMETSAQVARQAAEIRDLQSLLNQSVNLITERFDYYHAGIFLLDNAGRYAVLQAASSPGGQRMLARGHRLQVGKVGVVGYTAGSGQPRISQDVGADVVYYDNPDMPQTRSELALPLIVRKNVIGVLDVQSIESTAFATEDVDVLQILADQIALAIDNVRLLQSSQRALEELQRLYGQQAGQAWRQKLAGQQRAYQFTPTGLEEGDQKATISLQNRPGYKLRKEIKFRGQVIGNLNLMREQDDASWSVEEQSLIDEILEQTALALENARLVDQIRLRSEQIELLQEISTISSEILDEEKLLPIITEKLFTSLAVSHCGVVLLGNIKATLAANFGDVAGVPDSGFSINIDEEPISQRLIRNKEVDIFKIETDDDQTVNFVNNFSVPETKTIICLPIIVREQTAGFIYFDETSPDREIDTEEFNLFNQLSTQISTAVENIRLFDETTNRAERERQVAEITSKMRSSNDPKSILQTAVIELKKALKTETKKTTDDIQTSTPSPTGD